MKKLFTIILSLLLALQSSHAQVLNCNAGFSPQYQSANIVKFIPAFPGDTVYTFHTWVFGDGTNNATSQSPIHTYTNAGVYIVKHIVRHYSNSTVCNDTAYMTITIQSACNLIAGFNFSRDSSNGQIIYFQNTSTPTNTSDSVRWTFGDGSSSNTYNSIHTYANAATYNVCLRIQQRINGALSNCVREVCQTVVVGNICNLVVGFNPIATSAINTYHFQNNTTGIHTTDSIRWNFGDGSHSNALNPDHTFANNGNYTVCLRVIQRDNTGALTSCDRTWCQQITVGNTCNLHAGYTFTQSNTSNGVAFVNTSQGMQPGDSIRWTFGDGTSSSQNNPTHIYNQQGHFRVCLIISRMTPAGTPPCVSEYCDSIYINNGCNLQAYFTASTVNNTTNTFYFHNNTGGLAVGDSIKWTFGDGSSSTDINATHLYAQAGTYNVCLRVKKPTAIGATPCVSEFCQIITIAFPCNIQPSYTYHADSANSYILYFQNTTSITTSTYVYWSFGDGSGSNQLNPSHYYHAPGQYTVCLRIQSSQNCVRYYCDTITVTAGGCYVSSEFSYFRSQTNTLLYQFQPRMRDSTWSYSWNFGDGSTASNAAPNHQFPQPGSYNICLTVTTGLNCSSTTCKTIIIRPPLVCDSIRLGFVYRKDAYTPNKVYFYTVANYPVISQNWTITKLNSTAAALTLYGFNPIYYFQDTGSYRVCLHAVMLGGCIKDTCEIIHIDHVAPAPNPCYLHVYPNPASNYINLSLQLTVPQTVHVSIYNSMNIRVADNTYSAVAGNNTFPMFVGNLIPGTYFVRVVYGNSVCYSRFIKY